MSRIAPETRILNCSPQLDRLGQPVMGIVEPLKLASGKHVGTKPLLARPLFNMPRPIGFVSHWASEADKREHGGDMTKARKEQLVQVPIFRGTDARFLNEIRGDHKRQKRMSLIQRIRAEIASRIAVNKEGLPA